MKINMVTLIASVFLMATTGASPLTTNEILSAIDGEYDYIASVHQRVNFDMSVEHLGDNSTTDNVLSAIDGEYTRSDTSRVHFSVSSSDVNDVRFVNSVLSGVGGEYYQ